VGIVPPVDAPRTLRDRAVKDKLQHLRHTDNTTNWYYLARAWVLILLCVGAVVGAHQWLLAEGYSPWWAILFWVPAVVVIGASQHQLAGATHEATHYILFKNRVLNEVISDLFCMFPLFSSTYVFRLHHLAHHQFINDPERDPDLSQLRHSGHWLKFPASKRALILMLLWQMTLIPLIFYVIIRARFSALGLEDNPYIDKDRTTSPRPRRIAVLHTTGLFGLMVLLSLTAPLWAVIVAPVVWTAGIFLLQYSIPAEQYFIARLKPALPPKTMMLLRVCFVFLLYTTLGLAAYFCGWMVWVYFLALWMLPIFTTFSLFMILRQLVQHGNCDRGWLTNTRTFLINPLIRYAVFPFGMDYHLAHHMYASIPHYNLPKLHEFLMQIPEYREQGIVVEGYFFSPHHGEPRNPTVLEVLGPDYHKGGEAVYIDESVVAGEMSPGQ
jgi:fatty acid desaturase